MGLVDGADRINGIESVWSFTKRRLASFNGPRRSFERHLKECEWRWRKDCDTLVQNLIALLSRPF